MAVVAHRRGRMVFGPVEPRSWPAGRKNIAEPVHLTRATQGPTSPPGGFGTPM